MPQQTLVYDGIHKVLLSRFPELQLRLEKAFGSYYDLRREIPEAYPVFEDVLKRTVLELLASGTDEQLLTRIFAFLEEMANSDDSNVTDLLGISILEPLTFDRARIRPAWKYMGKKTRDLARETASYGGWLENLPPDESSTGS